ncbi:unnamed protein product [Rangifer tarandus platyrhynchus]|uniref:Uncharacterized protein n=1 Tax=Rangifer tarandus platyrhynchus TaxID=3082113 RepID=A0AC60A7Q7_RANTA
MTAALTDSLLTTLRKPEPEELRLPDTTQRSPVRPDAERPYEDRLTAERRCERGHLRLCKGSQAGRGLPLYRLILTQTAGPQKHSKNAVAI